MIAEDRLLTIAEALSSVAGVRAVVLGGSRARGTHHAESDVDLGIYYDAVTLDLHGLTEMTGAFNATGQVVVAGPGEWGPWVNGGGWLKIDDTDVDWILRDVDRVHEQCQRARRGQFEFHPQPGHPLGFLDVSYAGEVASCRTLVDPEGLVAELQSGLRPYPVALEEAMVANLWQADFLVAAARKALPKQDVAYIGLCCSTALMLCAHAWHARAGVWVLNEKGVVPDTSRLPVDTHGFAQRAAAAIADLGGDGPARTTDLVGVLVSEARAG